jgi:hypothetical protein
MSKKIPDLDSNEFLSKCFNIAQNFLTTHSIQKSTLESSDCDILPLPIPRHFTLDVRRTALERISSYYPCKPRAHELSYLAPLLTIQYY